MLLGIRGDLWEELGNYRLRGLNHRRLRQNTGRNTQNRHLAQSRHLNLNRWRYWVRHCDLKGGSQRKNRVILKYTEWCIDSFSAKCDRQKVQRIAIAF